MFKIVPLVHVTEICPKSNPKPLNNCLQLSVQTSSRLLCRKQQRAYNICIYSNKKYFNPHQKYFVKTLCPPLIPLVPHHSECHFYRIDVWNNVQWLYEVLSWDLRENMWVSIRASNEGSWRFHNHGEGIFSFLNGALSLLRDY